MQIGIDLGASKIEYVLLDDSGNEHHRERIEVPKDYKNTLAVIKKIVVNLEKKSWKRVTCRCLSSRYSFYSNWIS